MSRKAMHRQSQPRPPVAVDVVSPHGNPGSHRARRRGTRRLSQLSRAGLLALTDRDWLRAVVDPHVPRIELLFRESLAAQTVRESQL